MRTALPPSAPVRCHSWKGRGAVPPPVPGAGGGSLGSVGNPPPPTPLPIPVAGFGAAAVPLPPRSGTTSPRSRSGPPGHRTGSVGSPPLSLRPLWHRSQRSQLIIFSPRTPPLHPPRALHSQRMTFRPLPASSSSLHAFCPNLPK